MFLSSFDKVSEYLQNLGGVQPTACEDGAIRLIGETSNRGRVEICRGNVWGSVCRYYNYFTHWDHHVMCRTLGYSNIGKIWSDYRQ